MLLKIQLKGFFRTPCMFIDIQSNFK